MNNIKIFACPSANDMATTVAKNLKKRIGKITFQKFKNDNTFVKIDESVRGKNVYIFQSTTPPVNERVMELLIAIDAFKRADAKEINIVLPYFIYARSDKKDQPRIAVTAKLFAKMLETAGATRIITCDIHNPAIQSYFEIGCECITARYTMQNYFADKQMDNLVVVATDAGSSKAAFKYSEFFNCPVALIDKRRSGNNDKAIASNVIGEVKGKNTLIFDDEVDTAGSLIETARILEREGANAIFAGCTHGVLSADAVERIKASPIHELVITDSIPIPSQKKCDKIKVISIAPIITDIIRRLESSNSLTEYKY